MTNMLFNKISEDVTKLLFDYQKEIEEALSLVDSGETLNISFSAKIKPQTHEQNEVSVNMSFVKYRVKDGTEKTLVNETQITMFERENAA